MDSTEKEPAQMIDRLAVLKAHGLDKIIEDHYADKTFPIAQHQNKDELHNQVGKEFATKELKMLNGDPTRKPSIDDSIVLAARNSPSYRTMIAIQDGVEKNILINTWGGLGDQICSEPTLRYGIKKFSEKCQLTLATPYPELFRHLKFNDVINTDKVHPIWSKYLVFNTIVEPTHITWEFFSHCITNCVDFPSLCAFRMQLPIKEKDIYLTGDKPTALMEVDDLLRSDNIFIHAGRHWPTKTFPKDWWDNVLKELKLAGFKPIIIGQETTDNRGTVDVNTDRCIDLRGKLKRAETVWLLQRANLLLTNDSAPLHMAASSDPYDTANTGHCHIGTFATCKHFDYISHWRKGQWQYRETNLALGSKVDYINECPNQKEEVRVDQIDERTLRTWLPEPRDVAQWAVDRHGGK